MRLLCRGFDGAGARRPDGADRRLRVGAELDQQPGGDRAGASEAAAAVEQHAPAGPQQVADHRALDPPALLGRRVRHRDARMGRWTQASPSASAAAPQAWIAPR